MLLISAADAALERAAVLATACVSVAGDDPQQRSDAPNHTQPRYHIEARAAVPVKERCRCFRPRGEDGSTPVSVPRLPESRARCDALARRSARRPRVIAGTRRAFTPPR